MPKKEQKKRLTASLPLSAFKTFQHIAEAECLTISWLLRKTIKDFIDNWLQDHPNQKLT